MSQEERTAYNFPITTEEKLHFVQELCQPFQLNWDTLMKIKTLFLKEIKNGLGKKKCEGDCIKCVPTYIQKLPTDCEKGKCFFIEISGGDFLIQLLTFNGAREHKNISERYYFPEHLLGGDAIYLINYMVEYFCGFVKKLSLHLENLSLAISLAFYARYDDTPLCKKNFNIPQEISDNIEEVLRNAIETRGDIKISNYVLVNDVAAVLTNSAWKNVNCKIAVVVDQSTSACYLEQIKHISALENRKTILTIPTMIVETQWRTFGDNGKLDFIRTSWDYMIEEHSAERNKCVFEKIISGRYIGSIVHLILLECIKWGVILEGNITSAINTINSFPTSHVIDIESQCKSCYYKTRHLLRLLGYKNPQNIDCDIVRIICETITLRSVNMVAATLAALIDHIGDPYLVVGIEGNICRKRAFYRENLQEKLKELVRPEHKFDLIFPEAKRGCGAALAAIGIVNLKKKFKAKELVPANLNLFSVRGKKTVGYKRKNMLKKCIRRGGYEEGKTDKVV